MMQLERNEFEEEAGLGYKYIYIYNWTYSTMSESLATRQ